MIELEISFKTQEMICHENVSITLYAKIDHFVHAKMC